MTLGARAVTVLAAAALLAAGAAGCGSSQKKEARTVAPGAAATTSTASTSSTNARQSATRPGAVAPTTKSPNAGRPKDVAVMTSNFGHILNAPGGHALYVFTHDAPGHGSTCYGACAGKWPPFLVRQIPRARNAVQQHLLGMIRRKDGRLQATYSGHPLYFYFAEKDPGEVLCQGVSEFGGTWYVVAPGGKPVQKT